MGRGLKFSFWKVHWYIKSNKDTVILANSASPFIFCHIKLVLQILKYVCFPQKLEEHDTVCERNKILVISRPTYSYVSHLLIKSAINSADGPRWSSHLSYKFTITNLFFSFFYKNLRITYKLGLRDLIFTVLCCEEISRVESHYISSFLQISRK